MSPSFEVFSNPEIFYEKMLDDLKSAKKYIFIETYLFGDDAIGKKFLKVMSQKAREGVKVRLLIDTWGFFYLNGRISYAKKNLFKEYLSVGGELKFFRELRYTLRIFSDNYERGHRKMILIDDKISYLGSYNIIQKYIKNRELVLRFENDLALQLKNSFEIFWQSAGRINRKKLSFLAYRKFQLLHDIPSRSKSHMERNYARLINESFQDIRIETPYFIPSPKIIRAMTRAVSRGVRIKLIIPKRSNWKIVDLMRNKYLGYLHKKGVQIFYYLPNLLHSKLLIIDDAFFLLGSSNVDYRSFLRSYEINLLGHGKEIIHALEKHFNETLSESEPFDYTSWKERSSVHKILEVILAKIRKLV